MGSVKNKKAFLQHLHQLQEACQRIFVDTFDDVKDPCNFWRENSNVINANMTNIVEHR
jgi:hypothetical protein